MENAAAASIVDPAARERFYQLLAQVPETETAWEQRQAVLQYWRLDSGFEPYWPSIDHMLEDDYTSFRRRGAALANLSRGLEGYDFDACREQREHDLNDAARPFAMILVDTTVVIDWSQGKDPKLQLLLPTLPVAVCGVTQAEFLHGSRDPAHRQRLLTDLAAFPFVPMPDPFWVAVGDNLATLRSNGVSVPFPDAVIATVGIEHDLEIWTRDRHFASMQQVLPRLRLFHEPP